MLARLLCFAALFAIVANPLASAQDVDKTTKAKLDTSRGDAMIAEYFRRETQQLADACLADIQTADDWNAKKDEYRRQLREMLGLDPLPEKTDLQATVTGTLDHAEFTVEKLHFQSRPGLYVTGNLYVPKVRAGKVPAILYVCGHGNVKKDGVSYGSKSHYQHHGAWFARNGYVCLVIDTLQLGEIEGIHHGTYRYNMWWWLNRGYTPAGVEAWNCVRALDYLQSRPEVDGEKLGVTGRSGGGAYSWWIAAIDERIKCAVPVAGITDLTNHVVDGCVEGHCDCMYMVNAYRWDYPQVAALVAPRPLLISNTDSDRIFPLDGVVRVFEKARRIYTLLGKRDQIGLNITSGGHLDTQELQVTAMRWFNHHLRGYDGPVTNHAEKFFKPEQLKVFDKLPEDEINTKIHETFVAAAPPPKVPENQEEWEKMRGEWMKQLKEKCFGGWPNDRAPLDVEVVADVNKNGWRLRTIEFTSEPHVRLRLYYLRKSEMPSAPVTRIQLLDGPEFETVISQINRVVNAVEASDETAKFVDELNRGLASENGIGFVYFSPRGVGEMSWDRAEKKQIQHRRRFMLLGESLHASQGWDALRAIDALRSVDFFKGSKIDLSGAGQMGSVVLLAAALEPKADSVTVYFDRLDASEQPSILNLSRVAELPVVAGLAASQCPVRIVHGNGGDWQYLAKLAAALKWDGNRVQFEKTSESTRAP